jgi:hypothetical protein
MRHMRRAKTIFAFQISSSICTAQNSVSLIFSSSHFRLAQLFANCGTAEKRERERVGALGCGAIECGSQTTITSKGVMRWWRVCWRILKRTGQITPSPVKTNRERERENECGSLATLLPRAPLLNTSSSGGGGNPI